jgi:hypothetical protein
MLFRSFTFAIMFLAASSARAEMIAVTSTGGHPGISIDTWGWSFTTADTITVTSLGWSDYSNDGLVDPHQIAIWDMSGNLLLSGAVPAGTADPLISGFRFDSFITGTATLAPGAYVIGGSASLHDYMTLTLEPYGPNGGNGTVTFGQGITYIHTRSGDGFAFPTYERPELDWGAFGPNFRYAIGAAPSPVPEPSTRLLGGLACLILVGWQQPYRIRS